MKAFLLRELIMEYGRLGHVLPRLELLESGLLGLLEAVGVALKFGRVAVEFGVEGGNEDDGFGVEGVLFVQSGAMSGMGVRDACFSLKLFYAYFRQFDDLVQKIHSKKLNSRKCYITITKKTITPRRIKHPISKTNIRQ